jgi:hypothetical protein
LVSGQTDLLLCYWFLSENAGKWDKL